LRSGKNTWLVKINGKLRSTYDHELTVEIFDIASTGAKETNREEQRSVEMLEEECHRTPEQLGPTQGCFAIISDSDSYTSDRDGRPDEARVQVDLQAGEQQADAADGV